MYENGWSLGMIIIYRENFKWRRFRSQQKEKDGQQCNKKTNEIYSGNEEILNYRPRLKRQENR